MANDQQVFVVKTVAQKIAQKGNLTPRHTLVEAVSKALTVSNRHARRMVSRAQELGLVFRVTEDGEPDDGGKWIGLPETH